MAEFTIHNVRFYDFEPKSIQCMAYEDYTDRLALSRADGSIEIWNCKHNPFMQLVLPAVDEDASVEGLAWCNDRLFSVGLHGYVLEYDLALCNVKSRTAVTGGPTWCVALSPDKTKLAAGTEEGYVCLFDVCSSNIMYNKTLEKQEGRILSISWHWSNNYIVTGSINCVRLWSLKEGRVTRCSFAHGKNQEIIVWSVKILNDMTIVSGDSRGMVCFWNSTLGTLIESVQSHKADVLCIAVAHDQTYLHVSGVEPTIVRVCLVNPGGKSGKKARWVTSVKLKLHSHDVRALALSHENKLYSGGVDTILGVSWYPPKTVLKIPCPLYPGYISVGYKSESVLLRYKEKLELWRLGKPREAKGSGNYLRIGEDRTKLLELQCDEGDSIQWCALSPQGLWIAYILKGAVKIFQFFPPTVDTQVSIRRVRAMSKEIENSRLIIWLTEGKFASVTLSGTIQIISISDMEASVETVLKPKDCVVSLVCSMDGNILITTDVRQMITVYDLRRNQETFLPAYNSAVTAVGINPLSTDIIVVYSNNTIKEYSLSQKRYTAFSKNFLDNPASGLPKSYSVIRNVSFDSETGSLILLHDDSSLIVLDKEGKAPDVEPQQRNKMKRRSFHEDKNKGKELSSVETFGKFTFVQRSHQVLYFSHVKDKSVISVELDPVQLHDRLPPTFKVKKYGGV
ncbi:U3 small nucleolar RNA-associated protein 4 homolog isoform X2 [Palaemon carinicauda]|uniref:U3 small nucleolar RNA-associated protein 4 homolog isoform X1 n=1 Tax=Palaemon carinicauda TaxID=392227 RepID=UPI0035B5F60F